MLKPYWEREGNGCFRVFECTKKLNRRCCLLPGSSWWLSNTWCKHEHHLSYKRAGSFSVFGDSVTCWSESLKLSCEHLESWHNNSSGEFTCADATHVIFYFYFYLMECRAERGTDEDGDGRLQSPWRSSMERLQGESMDPTSLPVSDCSPSNLNKTFSQPESPSI